MSYPERMPRHLIAPLETLAEELQTPPLPLAAVLDFESARTWSAGICNVAMPKGEDPRQFSGEYAILTDRERRYIVALGLCQLTAIGIREILRRTGKRYTFHDLALMSSKEQLEGPVREYLLPYKGRMKDPLDVYMAVFCPEAIGKPLNWILPYKGRSYSLNRGLDKNRDGNITKAEAGRFILKRLEEWERIPAPAGPDTSLYSHTFSPAPQEAADG